MMKSRTLWVLMAGLLLLLPRQESAKQLAQRKVLENGLVVLVSEEHTLPLVTVSLLIKAGSYEEPKEKAGLAHLTASLLTEGTAQRTSKEISLQTDFIGASLSS